MERQGMFWVIRCQCPIGVREPVKISLKTENKCIDLGICVSYQNGWGLCVRLPLREVTTDNIAFSLETAHEYNYIPIAADKAFAQIDQLEQARFVIIDGQPSIVIDN